MKSCKRCGTAFSGGRADKVYCSHKCVKMNHQEKKGNKETRKQQARASWLKKKYNLTLDDYNYLVVTQSDRCAICLTDDKGRHGNWCVDHNHQTGEVRGLLCDPCNTGLGKFEDDADNLTSASKYLEASK